MRVMDMAMAARVLWAMAVVPRLSGFTMPGVQPVLSWAGSTRFLFDSPYGVDRQPPSVGCWARVLGREGKGRGGEGLPLWRSESVALRGLPDQGSAVGGRGCAAVHVVDDAACEDEAAVRGRSGERGEYVSILRETVNRGCNTTRMGRVYGNYKKRKLNIEHIVPRAVILAAIGNASAAEQVDACNDLFNMFLAVPNINRARRDYKFCAEPYGNEHQRRPTIIYGKLNSKQRKYSENARDVWWSLGNGL